MPSLRKAINAHCFSCSYDPLDRGTKLAQIERCCVTSCELYEVRPKRPPKRRNSQDKTSEASQPTGYV